MDIYLIIAEIPVNIFVIVALGLVGGVLAGLFGVGGGFIITPLLIFLGIPPAVAVASSTNQIIASSFTGFISHLHKKTVDIKLGSFMLIGGIIGSIIGVEIFALLKKIGQIDLVISLLYVCFLGFIGTVMIKESIKHIMPDLDHRFKKNILTFVKVCKHVLYFSLAIFLIYEIIIYSFYDFSYESILMKIESYSFIFIIFLFYILFLSKDMFPVFKEKKAKKPLYLRLRKLNLPWVVEFESSDIKMSAFLPISIGIIAGMTVSLMGIGGGFVMIPAMIYLLGAPSSIVVGTSLFQIIFTTSFATFMHAFNTQSVDMVLAFFLIIGGVYGAKIGIKFSNYVKPEKLRGFLALIILAVCLNLAINLFTKPDNLYNIEIIK